MQKLISLICSISFLVWIIPAGVFIKSNQEKVVCGGQRAICMCSTTLSKLKNKNNLAVALSSNSVSPKQEGASSSGSTNQYFVIAQCINQSHVLGFHFPEQEPAFYTSAFFTTIEHVPKV